MVTKIATEVSLKDMMSGNLKLESLNGRKYQVLLNLPIICTEKKWSGNGLAYHMGADGTHVGAPIVATLTKRISVDVQLELPD